MNLADLYKKHNQDKQEFNDLRNKMWFDMKQRHNNITSAFGDRSNVPEDSGKEIERELQEFRTHWTHGTGTRYTAMLDQHKQQIQAITGEPEEDVKLYQEPEEVEPAQEQEETHEPEAEAENPASEQEAPQPTKKQEFTMNKDDMRALLGLRRRGMR